MEHAAVALRKIVADSLRRMHGEETALLAWPLACGATVAERTRALRIANGVLQVEVPDAGWRSELQALAPRYVALLSQYAAGHIKRIEFVVAGPKPTAVPHTRK